MIGETIAACHVIVESAEQPEREPHELALLFAGVLAAGMSEDLALALLVPFVVIVVWYALRRAKRRRDVQQPV